MISSKQRALLRKLAQGLDPIFIIGKDGVEDVHMQQLADVLEAHELIKVKILETAQLDTRETCDDVAERLGAEPVQAIGSKFVIYKRAEKEKNRAASRPVNSISQNAENKTAGRQIVTSRFFISAIPFSETIPRTRIKRPKYKALSTGRTTSATSKIFLMRIPLLFLL